MKWHQKNVAMIEIKAMNKIVTWLWSKTSRKSDMWAGQTGGKRGKYIEENEGKIGAGT